MFHLVFCSLRIYIFKLEFVPMADQQSNLSAFLEHNLDPVTSRYIMGKYLLDASGEE